MHKVKHVQAIEDIIAALTEDQLIVAYYDLQEKAYDLLDKADLIRGELDSKGISIESQK